MSQLNAYQSELDHAGYTLIECLDQHDIETLVRYYHRTAQAAVGMGFLVSMMSQDLSYRQCLSQVITAMLRPKVQQYFPDSRLCFGSFIVKQPHLPNSEVQMHQDWSFVDETQFASYGIWCPLTDVDRQNGCLSVIQGSHLFNRHPRGLLNEFPYPELLPALQADWLTHIPMRAGQALVYDSRLFHCSAINHSDEERIVAAGLMVPQAAALRYYHRDLQNPAAPLEVFEVDDDFYTRLIIGVRPEGITPIDWVAQHYEPLSLDRFVPASFIPAAPCLH